MLIRYKTGKNGKLERSALVYTAEEHKISRERLDTDAIKIVKRLQRAGHSAYIVGGAVRDILSGNVPKDFDVSTNAEPAQIRKLFRNSRIIGKRFRLVHIFFTGGKIIEVSTFRSADAGGFQNIYGAIEEDALRRDFTINALYYDPIKEQILDYSGGYKDIVKKRLRPVLPLKTIFIEDPVRMIRAIKYSVGTGATMSFLLRRKLKSQAKLLSAVSPSRLTEEIFKILQSGKSAPIFKAMFSYGLECAVFPDYGPLFQDSEFSKRFFLSLESLDQYMVRHDKPDNRAVMVAALIGDYSLYAAPWASPKAIPLTEAYHGIKKILQPFIPANRNVELALGFLRSIRLAYKETGHVSFPQGLIAPEHLESLAPSQDPKGDRSGRRRRPPRRRGRRKSGDSPATKGPGRSGKGGPSKGRNSGE